ncbi:RcnB family protein [Rhodanobacter sp. DHB23]|uniref:RcnB family protein n=1 Tax=Rhodanobacter sp. DHB23 TaxID=2775923 RepID=UPI001783B8F3|nr:RcnB family protein [Rhodanobacter sp. DHB23]MBD8872212.1 RcnB family protein [Rhodanobacter sp. DHB23]
MKTLCSLMFVLPLLAGSGVALADHDHGHDRGHDRHDWQDRHGRGHHDDRRYVVVPRHGHDRHWERGHRYGGPIYVVQDYGRYRLRPPPHGYGWVRAENNDYLLVALATGIILDVAMH